MYLQHLNTWLRSDPLSTVSLFSLPGGGIGARRIDRHGAAVGFVAEGDGVHSAQTALDLQIQAERCAPLLAYDHVPPTQRNGSDTWPAPAPSVPPPGDLVAEVSKHCDKATASAKRTSERLLPIQKRQEARNV